MQLFQSIPTEVAQNYLEWPISPDSQLFQCFPTEVAQNDPEWPISPNSQLFQSFPTEVAQNDSEWPISPDLQLFRSFPTEVAQNDSEWPILHGQNKIHSDTRDLYERLLFYMNSCALSPMASLFSLMLVLLTFQYKSKTPKCNDCQCPCYAPAEYDYCENQLPNNE